MLEIILLIVVFTTLLQRYRDLRTYQWLIVIVLLYFALFNRLSVYDIKIIGPIQIIDIILIIMAAYILKHWSYKPDRSSNYVFISYLLLALVFALVSIVLAYYAIGYKDGLMQMIRNRVIVLVAFLFFSTIPLFKNPVEKYIDIFIAIVTLLSIYTIVYPFYSGAMSGIVSDMNLGGWNRSGAYILVPVSCFVPVLLDKLLKKTTITIYIQLGIVLLAIILSISKSTILSLVLSLSIYTVVGRNQIKMKYLIKKYSVLFISVGVIIVILPKIYNMQQNYFALFGERLANGLEELGFEGEPSTSWRGYEIIQLRNVLETNPIFGKAYDDEIYSEVEYLNNKRAGYRVHVGGYIHTGIVLMIWQGGLSIVIAKLLFIIYLYNAYYQSVKNNQLSTVEHGPFAFALSWHITQYMLNDFMWHHGAILSGFMYAIIALSLDANRRNPIRSIK
jgi:hypothetical protein